MGLARRSLLVKARRGSRVHNGQWRTRRQRRAERPLAPRPPGSRELSSERINGDASDGYCFAAALTGRGGRPEAMSHDERADWQLVDAVSHDLRGDDGHATAAAVQAI